MKRLEFIQKLALGFFALPLITNAKPEAPKLVLYTGYIAGISFYSLNNIYHFISPNLSLTLKREPDNKYDKNAISIWYNEYKLGYIPKKDNSVLANLMDGYYQLKAEVVKIKKEKFMPPTGIKISISRKS